VLISVNFSWHDQHYVTGLLSGSWELLLISAVLLLELKVKLLNLHVNNNTENIHNLDINSDI